MRHEIILHYVSINETFTEKSSSDTIRGMGKASQVLKNILETYGISQNKLAVAMETRRSNVGRWFHGKVDPTGDTIVDIVVALRKIEPEAAEAFVRLYLGELIEGELDESS